jgi:hypothetical protein
MGACTIGAQEGQLSIVEGGTAINFSTQGSGNFVLVAETEINNAAVSGGAGIRSHSRDPTMLRSESRRRTGLN